jgi:hypothetical protein
VSSTSKARRRSSASFFLAKRSCSEREQRKRLAFVSLLIHGPQSGCSHPCCSLSHRLACDRRQATRSNACDSAWSPPACAAARAQQRNFRFCRRTSDGWRTIALVAAYIYACLLCAWCAPHGCPSCACCGWRRRCCARIRATGASRTTALLRPLLCSASLGVFGWQLRPSCDT